MPGVTTAYQSGVHGSRPAANAGCILYACSTHSLIYRSDGSTWTTWMTIGSTSTTVASDAIWDAAGDLAVGTGADTAARLALTVPAANVLNVLGVANGETTPTWKAIHDGTAPVTQAIGDAAAAGTSLLAAHRDHKHGMPAASSLPGYEFDYVQRTTAVNITNTGATPDTILTANAVAYDGSTTIIIEFCADQIRPDPANGRDLSIFLYDGATKVCFIGYILNNGTTGMSFPANMRTRLTPSNASHTYSIRGAVSGGTGSVSAGDGASGHEMPAFIRQTRVA